MWRVVVLGILACASTAHAHRGSAKYVVVERTSEGASIDVELEVVDAAMELGLGEDAPASAVLARGDDLGALLARGITIGDGTSACSAHAGAPSEVEGEDGPPRLSLSIDYACPPGDLVLRDDTIFPTDAQHEAFVRIRFADDSDARVLRAGRQEVALGEPPSIPSLLGRFLVEGVLHLVTGYDHLLFLLSLVLTAGGLARREGMRVALRDVAIVVTAFTLGHSVTLIAAALGVIVLPSRLVESVIAGSIAVVALLNVWRPDERRSMPWLALGFGLVHGFGFSGVLAELGLPAQARVLSLLAFNVGIELAQLAFVAVMLAPLAWLAGKPGYRTWIVRGGSIAIALLALVWLVERATAP
ncbi:HupE/UreJ family protein [Sandaracinus amylolyticus]|uniref:Membrane protein n=1 Tax=Sandaracinus amylolyticus TaxID=927083 RepID=A0A0F6SFN4_9BACT|nr:HupE/UreJ family protein [Sandaracinus amylolyticus]AKF07249.1 Membrane protein [Sandaracinus amylolyticus]